MDVLKLIYPEHEIFVRPILFNKDNLSMEVKCNVPKSTGYTNSIVPYVTAENYTRILSQTCYLLADLLFQQEALPLKITISSTEFRQAVMKYQLYYRNLAMTFHEQVEKGSEFHMTLLLKDFREISRIDDFVIFSFHNKRSVISGEMSFVYKR